MFHIWIGPWSPPAALRQTWIDNHPTWTHILVDNNFISRCAFKCAPLIRHYLRIGRPEGAADLIRYEVLNYFGGFAPEADSRSLLPVDELLSEAGCFTVYENEFSRGSLVSPILACSAGHPFLEQLIQALGDVNPSSADAPWKTTGNLFVARMIRDLKPDVTIWPSHFFIPVHKDGDKYLGGGKVYSEQYFGSTYSSYRKLSRWAPEDLQISSQLNRLPKPRLPKAMVKFARQFANSLWGIYFQHNILSGAQFSPPTDLTALKLDD